MTARPTTKTATVMLDRRACLQGLVLTALACLGAVPLAHAANTQASASTFAACWMDSQGVHRAGWLQLSRQGAVKVIHAIELPTRGHGLALLPDGSLLVAARRPGDWLLHLSPGQKPQWLWQEPGRVFSGHVHVAADGQTVFTTEIDTDSGQGLLGVRNASTLEKRTEYMTKGLDPHAVLALPAIHSAAYQAAVRGAHPLTGMLFVANGGIDTATETGRVKRHLDRMDPSIACLHPDTGELLGQWRLPDNRLSQRHLAWAWPQAAGTTSRPAHWPVLGVALQAEHDDAIQKAAAPLLAVLSWAKQAQGQLTVARHQPPLAGYGGDVVATRAENGSGFVVSATRGDALAHYDLQGTFLGTHSLPEAGALAAGASTVWAGGRSGLGRLAPADLTDTPCPVTAWRSGRMDNHWLHT